MSVAFPSGYTVTRDSDFDVDLGTVQDQLDDGSIQTRVLADTVYNTIRCKFTLLTLAETDTLTEFLRTNRGEEITMTIDSVDYIGTLGSRYQKTMTGNLFNISFDYRAKKV